MSDLVRLGVLGSSSIAWRRTLPAMAEVPELELVAVASRDLDRARRCTQRFGGEALLGYDALLERDDIDAVYVPLPTGLHQEWVARALRSGKHVLAEKPLAVDAGQAGGLVSLAQRSGRVLWEHFTFLHHAQHRAVRDLLADGAIGELRMFRADFGIPPLPAHDVRYQPTLGGGALLDVGVYPLRAAQYFVDGELAVLGVSLRVDPASGVDVAGSALLCSSGGVDIAVGFGFEHHYRNTYEFWGSQGRIVVDRVFTPPATLAPVIRVERPGRVEELTLVPDDQFRNIAARFAQTVRAHTDQSSVDGRAEQDVPAEVSTGAAILRQAALVDAVRAAANRTT